MVRQLPDLHVPTESVNFLLGIHTQLLGVPLFKEVDGTSE